jgi:hypothetical protein
MGTAANRGGQRPCHHLTCPVGDTPVFAPAVIGVSFSFEEKATRVGRTAARRGEWAAAEARIAAQRRRGPAKVSSLGSRYRVFREGYSSS